MQETWITLYNKVSKS